MRDMNEIRDSNGRLPAYAWPGGYPMFYLTADGGVLCPDCANGEHGSEASTSPEADAQWQIVAYDANWEDPHLFCDHCSERIESAYAEEDS